MSLKSYTSSNGAMLSNLWKIPHLELPWGLVHEPDIKAVSFFYKWLTNFPSTTCSQILI